MKKPSLHLPLSLARGLAELTIIVAGVLIALGAQSWWEGRQVEEDRRRTMDLLYDDLTRLEAVLRDDGGAARVDSSVHRLLDGRLPAEDSTLTRMVTDALWNFGFDIGSRDGEDLLPAYADLKSSGRLGLLPDTVRSRMPRIELQLVVLSRFLDDMVHFQQTRVDPDLYENIELTVEGMPADGSIQLADPRQIRDVLADPAARNRMVLKSSLLRSQASLWRRTADSVAVVRRLIDSERDPR